MSISTSLQDGVATVAINRPDKKNALTADMYQAMADALNRAQADPAVRSVLLAGQPGMFTAGNDLEDFVQRPPKDMDAPRVSIHAGPGRRRQAGDCRGRGPPLSREVSSPTWDRRRTASRNAS